MSARIGWALVGLCVGAWGVRAGHAAEPPTAPTFTECAYVPAGWMPGTAPDGIPKKFEALTPVPAGFTVVGGSAGSFFSMLVCR
jgi:hypothetical protein